MKNIKAPRETLESVLKTLEIHRIYLDKLDITKKNENKKKYINKLINKYKTAIYLLEKYKNV